MGLLVPNSRRRITTEIGGQRHSGLAVATVLKEGKFLGLLQNKQEVSAVDGAEYSVARFQVKEGTAIRVVGYGPEAVAAFAALKQGDVINAYLTPMARSGYKLDEFITNETPAAQPAQ